MLKYINLQLNHFCPKDCFYCYLSKDSRKITTKFNQWDRLKKFLMDAELDELVYVNFVAGELSYFPELIRKASIEISKIERYKNVKFKFSIVTNGDNPYTVIDLIKDGYLHTDSMILSYDGAKNAHCNDSSVNILAPYISSISTAVFNESIDNILYTLLNIKNARPKSWEYYFLLYYPEYENEKFINKFSSIFLDRVYQFYKSSETEVYNIKAFKESRDVSFIEKPLWCSYGDSSLYITEDCHIIPCGAYAKESNYHSKESLDFVSTSPTLDTNPKKVLNACSSAREKLCKHTCDYESCTASQCTECGMVSSVTNNGNCKNHCKIRLSEYDFYNRMI